MGLISSHSRRMLGKAHGVGCAFTLAFSIAASCAGFAAETRPSECGKEMVEPRIGHSYSNATLPRGVKVRVLSPNSVVPSVIEPQTLTIEVSVARLGMSLFVRAQFAQITSRRQQDSAVVQAVEENLVLLCGSEIRSHDAADSMPPCVVDSDRNRSP